MGERMFRGINQKVWPGTERLDECVQEPIRVRWERSVVITG